MAAATIRSAAVRAATTGTVVAASMAPSTATALLVLLEIRLIADELKEMAGKLVLNRAIKRMDARVVFMGVWGRKTTFRGRIRVEAYPTNFVTS